MIKKFVDFYTRLSKREKWIFGVTSLILGVLLTDRLVFGPVRYQMKLMDIKVRDEEAAIKQSLHMLLRKDQIISEVKQYAAYSIEAGKPEEEMTSFLKEIENIAGKSSVSLLYVKPGNTKEDRGIKKYSANLECEGQMKEITSFFYNLENSSHLFEIEKYDLQPKGKESSLARCTVAVSMTVFASG